MGVRLTGMCLTGVYLTSVHLAGVSRKHTPHWYVPQACTSWAYTS
jgi:hypothetical protein